MKKIALLLALTYSIQSSGQGLFHEISGVAISTDTIAHFISERMEELNMAGLSFGLIEDGKLAFAKTFGYRNWDHQNRIDEQCVFEAASMSKPVFAWLVMKLAEKGVLDIDKPLYTYYDYPDINNDPNHQLITARLVLTHQTGLPNWRYGSALQTMFVPGSDFSYSGEGFVYLGKTLEHIMKMPLEDIFQQEVFRPLEMHQSTMIWTPELNQRKAAGHYNGNVVSTDHYKPLQANPAASLLTTVEDFSKFMIYVLEGKGLSKKTYQEMLSIQVTPKKDNSHQNEKGTINWGLGWVIEETPYGLIFQHGGNNGDFESYFELSKGHKNGYVYFTNSDQGDELNKSLNLFLREGKIEPLQYSTSEQGYEIPLNSERWKMSGSIQEMQYQMKKSFVFLEGGEAMLKDSTFKNMIIEFDVAFPDDYCNAGIRFRGQNADNYENFYLRAHESGTSQSMQYTPVFNGHSGWQLYSGYNYTGRATYLRKDGWIHVKIAVFDDWMEVYIDDMENLALHVFDLKRTVQFGYVSIWTDNTAFFSDFSIKEIDAYDFYYDRQPKPSPPAGVITNWDVSEAISSRHLTETFVDSLQFVSTSCEYNGLLNLGRFVKAPDENNTVIARVKVTSDRKQRKSLQFGYSDIGKIYLNGKILYDGQNMFQSRDDNFRGTIGFFERIYLDLEEGENSLWFEVTENFGGWGLMAKFDEIGGVQIENYNPSNRLIH